MSKRGGGDAALLAQLAATYSRAAPAVAPPARKRRPADLLGALPGPVATPIVSSVLAANHGTDEDTGALLSDNEVSAGADSRVSVEAGSRLLALMFPDTSAQALATRLRRPLVLDIVASSASAAGATELVKRGGGGGAAASLAAEGGVLFAGAGALASSAVVGSAGLAALSAGSATATLYRARIAARRAYLSSAEGLLIPKASATTHTVGPPFGARRAARAALAGAPAAKPATASTTLQEERLRLPREMCERLAARWRAYAWEMLSLAAAAASDVATGVTGSNVGATQSVQHNASPSAPTFVLSAMRADGGQVNSGVQKLRLAPEAAGASTTAVDSATAYAIPAISAAQARTAASSPAFLRSLDWHFCEVLVVRCRQSQVVGRRGFIVGVTVPTVALLDFSCASPRLHHIPRAGLVFAALLPDSQPSAGGRASSSSGSHFTSSLVVEVWGNILAPRLRASTLLRAR